MPPSPQVRAAQREARADHQAEARDENDARLRAAQTADRRAGAAVIALTLDTETGEVSEGILARFGQVPDDFDQLVESV